MNKKLIVTISAIVCVVILGFGIYQSDATQMEPKLSTEDISKMVRDQYPGMIKEIELENDQNQVVYDVELVNDDRKYEIKLDGNTGEIINLKEKSATKEQIVLNDDSNNNDSEKNEKNPVKEENDDKDKVVEQDKNETKTDQSETEKPKTNNKKTVIDAKEAIDIALNAFPGTVTDLELEKEDGRYIYEIEIESGKEEAEIEIDAYTGTILVIDIDLD